MRKRVVGATWHSGMGKSEYGGWSHAASNWWNDADDEGWAKSAGHRLILTDPDKGISDPEVLALLHERILVCLEASQKR